MIIWTISFITLFFLCSTFGSLWEYTNAYGNDGVSKNNYDDSDRSKHNNNEYWKPLERFHISQNEWRLWLERQQQPSTNWRLDNYRNATIVGNSGCGMSLQVTFPPETSSSKHQQQLSAFFKVNYDHTLNSHTDAESHLREIKSAYLDQILGTNIAMPAVGYRLLPPAPSSTNNNGHPRRSHQKTQIWNDIYDSLQCMNRSSILSSTQSPTISTNTREEGIEGSMMLFLPSVVVVPQEEIQNEARDGQQSALLNALFLYVGGCFKTEHNFFYYEDGGRFVALDNDRCFMPNILTYNSTNYMSKIQVWKELVYELACQLPTKVTQTLLEQLKLNRHQGSNNNKSISAQIRDGLKEDVLYEELIASQPETFQELDQRVVDLAIHIQNTCTNTNSTNISKPKYTYRTEFRKDGQMVKRKVKIDPTKNQSWFTKKYVSAIDLFTKSKSNIWWSNWLEKYNNRTIADTSTKVKYVQKVTTLASAVASDISRRCGFSVMIHFEHATNRAYFKNIAVQEKRPQGSDEDPHSHNMHYNEIKASYLDRILGTNVTLPCVGHTLALPARENQRAERKQIIGILEECNTIVSGGGNGSVYGVGFFHEQRIEGSMMFWLDNLEKAPLKNVIEDARSPMKDSELQQKQSSALNFIVFQYLGGCSRTISVSSTTPNAHDGSYNNFVRYYADDSRYVSVDNSLCFIPKKSTTNAMRVTHLLQVNIVDWTDLTYELACYLPAQLQRNLIEAATTTEGAKISSRLRASLKNDMLSDQIIESSLFETFDELDQRVEQLAVHINQTCEISV